MNNGQKYPIDTKFLKEFDAGIFEGWVDSYYVEEDLYKVVYTDGDWEVISEQQLQKQLDVSVSLQQQQQQRQRQPQQQQSKKRKKAPDSKQQTSNGTTAAAAAAAVKCTTSTRYGRSVTKANYNYDDDMSADGDTDDSDDVPLAKKQQRLRAAATTTARKKRAISSGPSAAAAASKKKKKKGKGKLKRSDSDSESDASIPEDEEDDDTDLEEDGEEEEEVITKKKKGTKAKQNKKSDTEGKGKKMYEAFEPINTPTYSDLSLADIQQQKDYLDPGGMEATDDIIGSLVGDQVSKLAPLLVHALQHDNENAMILGSVHNPLLLGTACSGTDAPSLALTLIQEQLQLLLQKQQEQSDLSSPAKLLHFSHEFSCELEPFKQAFLARNFDSILYPDIVKLSQDGNNEQLRDVYGRIQPLPSHNLFIAGTSCKGFSNLRTKFRETIEDRGCSGETFLAAVETLFKAKPHFALFENVITAPWVSMKEYITGRVKLSNYIEDKKKKKKSAAKPELIFERDSSDRILVDQVVVYGVRCGAVLSGYERDDSTGQVEPVDWPETESETCTFKELADANGISVEDDTLVFETPCTYCAHWINVDTKQFGLPQTRRRTYMLVWQPRTEEQHDDDLGIQWEAVVRYLESPVRHSLEAFLLQADHDVIRVFREALIGPAGRTTKRGTFMESDFWTSARANLLHNKTTRERIGMEELARPITHWAAYGQKQIPPHYWLEYLNCNPLREMDMIDILHASAARDAESHDSSYASYYWNISQNTSKEKHKAATPGIAGCITPGGDFLLPHQGRPMLGCEKLLVQGIPYFRLALGNETEVQLGDLAGNAMSLTVVSACILAAIVSPQLPCEVTDRIKRINLKRKSQDAAANDMRKTIREYVDRLDGTGNGKEGRNPRGRGQWTGEISIGSISLTDNTESRTNDRSSLAFFRELAKLAPVAVKSSICCTCESSGANSRTNKFLQCKVCHVSCCRDCICSKAGYNMKSHDVMDVEIGNGNGNESTDDVRNMGTFQSKLRYILPPSLYFVQEGINSVASVGKDQYRVNGLDKFTFTLHRIKRNRGKWLIIYYARENNGIGEAVAELQITIGEIRRGQASEQNILGVVGELTSFMPARSEPLKYGKLCPCCKITIPYIDGPLGLKQEFSWEIKKRETLSNIKLSGSGCTPSLRSEVGLNDVAQTSLEAHVKKKNIVKGFKAAKDRGEERRWLYVDNWKEWPESIVISSIASCSVDDRILGTYQRAKCRQTTNQSALWIKNAEDGMPFIYILLKPNVNRTGFDHAIITTSMDHNDASCILAELDEKWQPSDALKDEHHDQVITCYAWQPDAQIHCMVPASKIEVKSSEDENDDSLVAVSGLNETQVEMLYSRQSDGGENGSSLIKLDVWSGQQAQQIVRVINSIAVIPILRHAAMGGLKKYDLSPQAEWKTLSHSSGLPFGYCKTTIPERPTEQWYFDDERGTWERSSEPGASRKYYLQLQSAPKPFEFWLDRKNKSLAVKCFPKVVAHHAASQLLSGRGAGVNANHGNLTISVRLSDVTQQRDPTIDRYKVPNCHSFDETDVELRPPHKLYDRQKKVVTKMLDIENGKTSFTETEISEFEIPGSMGLSLIAKAERCANIRGGVIADAIGAGKTVISIAIILKGIEQARLSAEAPQKSGASLVVVPPALIGQWKTEIEKFTTSLKVVQIYDFTTLQKTTSSDLMQADVVICPIDILESKGYLGNLVKKAGLQQNGGSLPTLPTYSGQIEQTEARGVWIPHTSADPYAGGNKKNSQKWRNQSAYYSFIYLKAIEEIRGKSFSTTTIGVPLEYFEWERIFVDEIHESLCTTRAEVDASNKQNKEDGIGFFKEKNRRAGRELLGISQRDVSKRPLVCRKSVIGLTGTPLLDSSNRVIELANMMGGTYLSGLSSHWRKLERESCRDIFLHSYLEPKQTREIRTNIYETSQDFVQVGCCRNKSGEEMDGIKLVVQRSVVKMTNDERTLYLQSQDGISPYNRSLAIKPGDFDYTAGHDISCWLRQNANLDSRGAKLLEICNGILNNEPKTKIVVFTDGRIGAGEYARKFLCVEGGPGCTWLDHSDSIQEKNKKIGYYQTGDATKEDRERPRILVLHYEHAAGLNLQTECHNLILFTPLYVGVGGTSGDPVSDTSTELQAIGRVFRPGQTNPKVHVYRIEVQGPEGEDCLDGQLIRRNTDPETVAMATNAGED